MSRAIVDVPNWPGVHCYPLNKEPCNLMLVVVLSWQETLRSAKHKYQMAKKRSGTVRIQLNVDMIQ